MNLNFNEFSLERAKTRMQKYTLACYEMDVILMRRIHVRARAYKLFLPIGYLHAPIRATELKSIVQGIAVRI